MADDEQRDEAPITEGATGESKIEEEEREREGIKTNGVVLLL